MRLQQSWGSTKAMFPGMRDEQKPKTWWGYREPKLFKSCAVAHPMQRNSATFSQKGATMTATTLQPTPLKALANRILDRNQRRNPSATEVEKHRNLSPKIHPQKLRSFSGKILPEWCSNSCSSLAKLNVSTGNLYACRIENERGVSSINLSFMKGCPKKMGPAAMNDEGWPKW